VLRHSNHLDKLFCKNTVACLTGVRPAVVCLLLLMHNPAMQHQQSVLLTPGILMH